MEGQHSNNQQSLDTIRCDLETKVGECVWLKTSHGRRQTMVRKGTVENIYPYHVLIRLDENSAVRHLSVSYADILTQTVQISFDQLAVNH